MISATAVYSVSKWEKTIFTFSSLLPTHDNGVVGSLYLPATLFVNTHQIAEKQKTTCLQKDVMQIAKVRIVWFSNIT